MSAESPDSQYKAQASMSGKKLNYDDYMDLPDLDLTELFEHLWGVSQMKSIEMSTPGS